MWSNKDCKNCEMEIFNLFKMVYSFSKYDDVIIAATNTGINATLDKMYDIKESSESYQYRIFVKGNRDPILNLDNQPTFDWIESAVGYIPRKEHVLYLNDHNYGQLQTKYESKNILMLFCQPTTSRCQNLISGYLAAADVFKYTSNALFVYVDCQAHSSICVIYDIREFPSFRLIPASSNEPIDEKLTSRHGENIVAYMNEKCHTRYTKNGSYDELYGRTDELDVLAHQFMNTNDVDTKKYIAKVVYDKIATVPEAGRYFKLMQKILKSDDSTILGELSLVRQQLKTSTIGSKENKALTARFNVVHQFEKIVTWKALVLCHPWNYNYLIKKNHMMVLITNSNDDTSKQAKEVFENLAKKGVRGIIIAKMNGDKYADFLYPFHFTEYPKILFYYKGDDFMKPHVVNEEVSLFSLIDYVDDRLDDYYANEL